MVSKRTKSYWFCIVAILFFSTIEIVGKLIGDDISPYAVTAWRFFIGGLILLPFAIQEKNSLKSVINGIDILWIAMAGILNVCISMLLLQLSVFYGKAVLSAVIVATNPIFVVMISYLFMKENITRLHLIGLGLGITGLFLIIFGEREALLQSRNLVLGVIFGLCAAFTFGIYTVYSKKLILKYGNLTTLCTSFLSGSVILFIISALTGKQIFFIPNVDSMLYLLYLSIFVTGIAYILYFSAIKDIGAANASIFFFLKPAIAAVLAWSLHIETLNLLQIFGIVIIMLSLSREPIFKLLNVKYNKGLAA